MINSTNYLLLISEFSFSPKRGILPFCFATLENKKKRKKKKKKKKKKERNDSREKSTCGCSSSSSFKEGVNKERRRRPLLSFFFGFSSYVWGSFEDKWSLFSFFFDAFLSILLTLVHFVCIFHRLSSCYRGRRWSSPRRACF